MPDTRKLAAIMFTDIKDFTQRMNAQEQLGMRLLEAHNGIMDAALSAHGGVLVKNIGDAYLVDFSSAVNALEAAAEAQEGFSRYNDGRPSEEQVLVRISIHLGDVVMHDGDLFGDGVNIASRLQSITPPGSICISRDVYAQVRSKLPVEPAPLGAFSFKGVAEPVEVYQVPTALVPAPVAAARPGQPPAPAEQHADLSIAVLPFANRSEDRDNEYFSDGITEDIITDLAKISALRVSSRNSAYSFKGKNASARQVGSELNVRYVLEGSLRRAGSRIRVTAQLVDSRTETHLWAERFDRDVSDIFAVQDEIARAIVTGLHLRLTRSQEQSLENHGTRSLPAWESYQKGLLHSRRRLAADLDLAEKHFLDALEMDPSFAMAHAALAWALRFRSAFGFDRDPRLMERARAHAERALQLEADLPDALLMRGLVQRDAGTIAESISTFRALLDRVPSHSQGHQYLGNALRDAGMMDAAIASHTRAMELDPKDFMHPQNICEDLRLSGDFRAARPLVDRAASLAPSHPMVLQYRAFLAAADGDFAAADAFIGQMVQGSTTIHAPALRAQYLMARGDRARALDDLLLTRDRGGSDPVVPLVCLPGFLALRRLDDALAVAERVLAEGSSRLVTGTDTRTLAFFALGHVRRARGQREGEREAFKGAVEEAARWRAVFPGSPALCAAFAEMLALSGDLRGAADEVDRLLRDHPGYRMAPYYRAVICAEQDDRPALFRALRTLREQGTLLWWGLKDDIAFARFAADPAFLEAAGPSAFG